MNKKNITIFLEIIPIVSAIIATVLIKSSYNSAIVTQTILVTIILAFLGFIFFFIGKKLCKENKLVRILGILDLISTLYIIILYTIVFLVFGL